MTTTTIKVDSATRDRLKAQAAAAHLTLGQHLARLAAAADREARFVALDRAVRSTSDADRAGWEQETTAWEAAELSGGVETRAG